jgi:3-hydroxyacyl-[acyl-carrier-protein] dehydratase
MRIEYFQLIDRITQIDLIDSTIRAEANVPETNTIFEGHFPGYPIMPGVLLIEAMAQTSGWLLIARTHFERMPFLASIREAKLRSFVLPGQALIVHAKLAHDGSGYAVTEAEIRCGGKLVCNADITLRLMPFADAGLRASMEELAARIGLPLEGAVDG